jgi:hypothetical protein
MSMSAMHKRDHFFKMATVNMFMEPGTAPYIHRRYNDIKKKIRHSHLDYLCLQDVWAEGVVDSLAAELAQDGMVYHHYRRGLLSQCACKPHELELDAPFFTCVNKNCGGDTPKMNCVQQNCGTLFADLSNHCRGCLMAVMKEYGATVMKECVTDAAKMANHNCTWYGSQFGLVTVAHKFPLRSAYTELDSEGASRAVLYDEFSDPDVGSYHMFCTHLTPPSYAAYSASDGNKHTSWEHEHKDQVKDLLAFVNKTVAHKPGLVVILGALNAGPAIPKSQAF